MTETRHTSKRSIDDHFEAPSRVKWIKTNLNVTKRPPISAVVRIVRVNLRPDISATVGRPERLSSAGGRAVSTHNFTLNVAVITSAKYI